MAEREWFEKDYYQVLGISDSATDKEVTRAYRKLAKALHPDTNPGSEERFKEVSVAYDVLGDADKRKEYDEVRRLGPAAAGVGGPGGFNFTTGDFTDLGDLFGGLFGGRRRGPQRGADLETALHLSFADAVAGVTTTVTLPSSEACHTCGGNGAAPGTGFVQCERCGGRGVLNDDQGPFAMSTICPVCHGRGGTRRHALPDLPRHRPRALGAPGQRADPARGRRGPAHPAQGQGPARRPRRAGRRPVRRRPRDPRRALRPQGPPRHHDGQRRGHRGAAGHDRRGPDPRPARSRSRSPPAPSRARRCACAGAACRPRASTAPATCW